MNLKKNEQFIVWIVSLAAIGLFIENILMSWEVWALFIIIFGIVSMWAIQLTQKIEYNFREMYYFSVAVLMLFYHGVHKNGLFGVALTTALAMVTFAMTYHTYMINILLAEFFTVIGYHLMNLSGEAGMKYDKSDIVRIVFQTAVVFLVYAISTRFVNNAVESAEQDKLKDERIEAYDVDMEDFLSNISHELRTPVNVVNGMSDLLIKRNVGYEADAIKTAGIRLAYQIEDIQDYTECKRHKVIPEEENYMSISLIHDVVTSFQLLDNHDKIELIVDLDPKVPTKMTGDIKKIHKIFRHLLENSVKFTKRGGVYVKMYTENTEYGVNLCIEMTDTGIGMDEKALESVAEGMYQVNKKRNRSSGGIGLGIFIVYGFVHRMGGFVKIESQKGYGTTVRVTVPQKVADAKPCLELSSSFNGAVVFHVRSDKFKVPQMRDFYRNMATNLATGIRVPLYSAESVNEIERMKDKMDVRYIFMGETEYEENRDYFDELCKKGIVVVVSADIGFKPTKNSGVIVMPKPIYAYPVIKILNGEQISEAIDDTERNEKPVFKDVRALIVDDEPMNLVVAEGIFRDYGMIIDTAGSGREAIQKFRNYDYDVIFMDHMMPEMDGVEAMKKMRSVADDFGKKAVFIILTANAVSGAKEMFMKEGFDGFIAKPINTSDFERVMLHSFRS